MRNATQLAALCALPGRCGRLIGVAYFAWVAVAASAAAQVTLHADFDHGSLDLAQVTVAGNLVSLAGRDNFNPGAWKWLYFSADGVANRSLVFEIGDNFATGGSDLNDHEMVYSYDQQTWHYFDNNARSASQDLYRFSNNLPFLQDTVYVAYGLPYSYGRIASHTSAAATSPWTAPTPSGDAQFSIGLSPGGVDDLGRSIAPRDIYGYQLTDPAAAGRKQKIVLLGGVHANETLGNYMLEGLVDFLLSDELSAGRLRRLADWYIYPMVNPDGRFAGYNRSTVSASTLDPNRFWSAPGYGGIDELAVVGNALLTDTGGDVDYFIDFHSTVADKLGHYGYVLPAMQNDPFWLAFTAREPEVDTRDATLINLTAAKFGRDRLNAEFSMTFETEFLAGETAERLRDLGRNMGLAMEEALLEFADLNFDGQLDPLDWQQYLAAAETDLSGLSPVEAYAAGDLNGDQRNDINDFGLFKSAYLQAHGPAGWAGLFQETPEPSTLRLIMLAAIPVGCRRVRIKRCSLSCRETTDA